MIWNTKYTDFLKGSRAYGIDIIWNNDSEININIIELIKKKGIIAIERSLKDIKSFDDLFKLISKDVPVILNIDGKVVIHKQKIKKNYSDNTDENHLSNVFPNITETDFFIQYVDSEFGWSCYSIIRKELLKKIIQLFTVEGFSIYNISLGPFQLNLFNDLLTSYNKISIGNYCIDIQNGFICGFTKTEVKTDIVYEIGSEKIENNLLIAYIGAISYYLDHKSNLISGEIEILRKEFLTRKTYKALFIVAVFLFFIILLFNYFLFNYYSKQLSESLLLLEQRKVHVNQLNFIKKEIALKETFFNSNRLLENSMTSYYSDRLVYNMPDGLALTELKIFPQERNSLEKGEFKFKKDLILVAGITSNTEELNAWFKELKKNNWISSLNIINLKQVDLKSATKFEFEILLKEH